MQFLANVIVTNAGVTYVDFSSIPGTLFAVVGFVDVLATVCASAIFNFLYPLSLKFDFNGTSFLVSAALGLLVLYLTT